MTTPTTGPSVQVVDAAVRSVLAERDSTATGNGWQMSEAITDRTQEVFGGRLLSLRHAGAFPPGVRQVRVAPGTVITPLARDSLKRLGIDVKFVARAGIEQVRNVGEWGFVVETETGVVQALRRVLLDGEAAWHELGTSLDDARRWVAGAVGRGALVLTDEASVAVFRACQVTSVRAAAAADLEATARAVRALGVNLLVVEPAGKSIALMKQIAATFRRAGRPVVPDWLGHPREGVTP